MNKQELRKEVVRKFTDAKHGEQNAKSSSTERYPYYSGQRETWRTVAGYLDIDVHTLPYYAVNEEWTKRVFIDSRWRMKPDKELRYNLSRKRLKSWTVGQYLTALRNEDTALQKYKSVDKSDDDAMIFYIMAYYRAVGRCRAWRELAELLGVDKGLPIFADDIDSYEWNV